MNLCANCKEGTTFLSSKESSDVAHTGEHIFNYVLATIEEVGPENVVQVVTDNVSNNMAAAKMLKEKMPSIFWTSCATHTINLMLEGIGKLPRFKKTLDSAKSLTIFIYAHHTTLALMRTFTKKRDIVMPRVTRFASAFLTLQSILQKKDRLRVMFSSFDWDKCKWSKSVKGKAAYSTVLSTVFWNVGEVAGADEFIEPRRSGRNEVRDLEDEFESDNEAVEENVEFESDDDGVFEMEEYVVEDE
ncbi:hypothetical protein EZV62_007238 [Acer yangbiense]|uniref:DUF659 domain-containing protein n=1 Tax=Acer yangbiense TaxID=1000413 RepID=A0A5C7I8Q2_9ROSI|nr:hypothetical protein EZV62_007238 [Acer yangbiense]